MEERKPIVGWEGKYEVSNTGRVRSAGFICDLGHYVQFRRGKELSLKGRTLGYCVVNLKRPSKRTRVHRLVAEAFIPNPEGKPHINHIDGVTSNNNVSNLERCTQKENMAHARNVLGKGESMMSGLKIGQMHLTQKKKVYQYTLDGKLVRVRDYLNQISKESEFRSKNVSSVILHGRGVHKGYRRTY